MAGRQFIGKRGPYTLADGHDITEIYSPASVRLNCSCGWSHNESRRQNALARAAKIRKAYRQHFESIGKGHNHAQR